MGMFAVRGEQQIKFSGILALAAEKLTLGEITNHVSFTPREVIRLISAMVNLINETPIVAEELTPYRINARIMDLQKIAFLMDHLNDPDSPENLVFA
jgi:methyl coenzyme M reductase subunit C